MWMAALPSWWVITVTGFAATLRAATVMMALAASAPGSLLRCPTMAFLTAVLRGMPAKPKRSEQIKAISGQGVSAQEPRKASSPISPRQTVEAGASVVGRPNFNVSGYLPIAFARPGAKLQFAKHGG